MRIYLSSPHMGGREQEYVAQAFAQNFVAPVGPQLEAFEHSVSQYLGGGVHCVALSSGSAALHLALRIAGVSVGDEVWISSMTFAGGIFPLNYLGAVPRFFDLSPSSWTVDLDLLSKELASAAEEGRLPKAIVPTDLYGQSVNLEGLEALAAEYGVRLIIDSAESLGARTATGRRAGSGGDASILSFNGNKIITTSGGGMFVTRHSEWAEQARFLATQARDAAPHYQHSTYGYNYRLSNICAAIGLGQMEVLDERVERRRQIFGAYRDSLSLPGVHFMPEAPGALSTRWLSAVVFEGTVVGASREDIRQALLTRGIEARPLWKPMHLQPLYSGAPYVGTGFDEALFRDGLCLPSGSNMTDQEQEEVIDVILSCLRGR